MVKTTVYLPDDLKHDLEEVARLQGLSEAEFLRRTLREAIEAYRSVPKPETGFLRSAGGPGTSDLALRVDELLEGFGE